jgi:hypothetical protein
MFRANRTAFVVPIVVAAATAILQDAGSKKKQDGRIGGVDMNISRFNADDIGPPRAKPDSEEKSETRKKQKEDEAVDEAEEESFPASDAPAYPDFE